MFSVLLKKCSQKPFVRDRSRRDTVITGNRIDKSDTYNRHTIGSLVITDSHRKHGEMENVNFG